MAAKKKTTTPRTKPARKRTSKSGRKSPVKASDIDPKQIERCAEVGCTYREMGHILGVSPAFIAENFAGIVDSAKAHKKKSLRRKQIDLALEGDRTMLVWLGKNWLGQSDRIAGADGGPLFRLVQVEPGTEDDGRNEAEDV